MSWVKSLQSALQDVIAIDGKTLNSIDLQNNKPAIHMVSAFATGARLVLAQQKVAEKSIDWLSQKSDWAGLRTIAMIEETCNTKGKVSDERRFFISN